MEDSRNELDTEIKRLIKEEIENKDDFSLINERDEIDIEDFKIETVSSFDRKEDLISSDDLQFANVNMEDPLAVDLGDEFEEESSHDSLEITNIEGEKMFKCELCNFTGSAPKYVDIHMGYKHKGNSCPAMILDQ